MIGMKSFKQVHHRSKTSRISAASKAGLTTQELERIRKNTHIFFYYIFPLLIMFAGFRNVHLYGDNPVLAHIGIVTILMGVAWLSVALWKKHRRGSK